MIERVRSRLSYANVMATLAVFIALGGSSYAVSRIDGADLRGRSVPGDKLERDTLTGAEIREDKLRAVPKARRTFCPGQRPQVTGGCLDSEVVARESTWAAASISCRRRGGRLPSYGELVGVTTQASGEWTSSVFESRSRPGELDVIVRVGDLDRFVIDRVSHIGGSFPPHAYRCVVPQGK